MIFHARHSGSAFRLAVGAVTLIAVSCVLVSTPRAGAREPASQTGQPAQMPIFRAAVDLVAVDVQVVNPDSDPILGLTASDFAVTINSQPRAVASADLIEFKSKAPGADGAAPEPFQITPGHVPTGSRVFVLAVDESSFDTAAVRPVMDQAREFVNDLRPSDIVGLYVFPFSPRRLDLTHSHATIGAGLDHVIGRREMPRGEFQISPSEIMDIVALNGPVFDSVVLRNCPPPVSQSFDAIGGAAGAAARLGTTDGLVTTVPRTSDTSCPSRIQAEASAIAGYLESQSVQSIHSLGLLLQDLGAIPGPKVVMVLSGGFYSTDAIGGRPDPGTLMHSLGAQAARSDVNLYVMHMDTSFLDAYSVATPPVRDSSARYRTLMRDSFTLGLGLERLADAAGGTVFRTEAGTGKFAFDRVLKETAAYYLLGVQPSTQDHDGRPLFLHVTAKVKGATVRSRTQAIIRK